MSSVELPVWTAAQPILAPRTMLGTFIWWAVLGDGLRGIHLAPPETKSKPVTRGGWSRNSGESEAAPWYHGRARPRKLAAAWHAPQHNIDEIKT